MKIAQNILAASSAFPWSFSQHSQMMCRFSLFAAQTVTAGRTDMQSVVHVAANYVPTLSSAIGEKKATNLWAKRQWHILSCRATIASVVCLPLIVAKKENGLWNTFF